MAGLADRISNGYGIRINMINSRLISSAAKMSGYVINTVSMDGSPYYASCSKVIFNTLDNVWFSGSIAAVIHRSTTGTTWTSAHHGTNNEDYAQIGCVGTIYGAASSGAGVNRDAPIKSTNTALTWGRTPFNFSQWTNHILTFFAGPDKFIMLPGNGCAIAYSTALTSYTWATGPACTPGGPARGNYAGDKYFIYGYGGGSNTLIYSATGAIWTATSGIGTYNSYGEQVTYGKGIYFFAGLNKLYKSTDGVSWSDSGILSSLNITTITAINYFPPTGVFQLRGDGKDYRSNNGVSWRIQSQTATHYTITLNPEGYNPVSKLMVNGNTANYYNLQNQWTHLALCY